MLRLISISSYASVFSLLLVSSSTFDARAADRDALIVVDPDATEDIATIKAMLYGFNQFPLEVFAAQKGERLGLPSSFFYLSALHVPEVEERIMSSGIDIASLTASGVIDILRTGHVAQRSIANRLEENDAAHSLSQSDKLDVRLLANLVSSELVPEHPEVYEGELATGDAQMVEVNPGAGKAFFHAYTQIDVAHSYDLTERVEVLKQATVELAAYPAMFDVLKLELAPISFGKPLPIPAEEQGLQIPASLLRRYDVYWIEFALSLRELDSRDVTEIVFDVRLPEVALALELIPLWFGKEKQIVESEATPEITVMGGGAAVRLGEFYRKTVAYTVLEPTIVAVGLRESNFAWRLRDAAVRLGSHKLIGIIGVPKGMESMIVGINVLAKTTRLLGLQGDIASTGMILQTVNLD